MKTSSNHHTPHNQNIPGNKQQEIELRTNLEQLRRQLSDLDSVFYFFDIVRTVEDVDGFNLPDFDIDEFQGMIYLVNSFKSDIKKIKDAINDLPSSLEDLEPAAHLLHRLFCILALSETIAIIHSHEPEKIFLDGALVSGFFTSIQLAKRHLFDVFVLIQKYEEKTNLNSSWGADESRAY